MILLGSALRVLLLDQLHRPGKRLGERFVVLVLASQLPRELLDSPPQGPVLRGLPLEALLEGFDLLGVRRCAVSNCPDNVSKAAVASASSMSTWSNARASICCSMVVHGQCVPAPLSPTMPSKRLKPTTTGRSHVRCSRALSRPTANAVSASMVCSPSSTTALKLSPCCPARSRPSPRSAGAPPPAGGGAEMSTRLGLKSSLYCAPFSRRRYAERLAEVGIGFSVAAAATRTTTPWPNPASVSTRPRSLTVVDNGAASTRLSWPRSTGSIGSLAVGSSPLSDTSLWSSAKSSTIAVRRLQPWWPESRNSVSGKPGTVQ